MRWSFLKGFSLESQISMELVEGLVYFKEGISKVSEENFGIYLLNIHVLRYKK